MLILIIMNSTNQSLRPITTVVNDKGHLEAGGCDLVELAKEYGTPLYVMDEKTLRSICRDYKKAFAAYGNIKFMYASKALCTVATSAVIASEGFGFDAVSGGEIYTIHRAGVDMSTVLFNGNNKSREELELAIKLGVGRISVDNFYELELLKKIGAPVDILLRITPGIECHTHEYIQTGHLDSKFGFDLTQIDDAIKKIPANATLKGLHAHIGSQIFDTQCYFDEVEILVKEIARLGLNEMNIGGGLGVKYTEQDQPPSTFEAAQKILGSLEKNIKKYGIEPPTIYIEPGRSTVCTAGVTLYTIGSSKNVPNGGTKYVAVDGGMSDNPRPSMYQAQYSAVIANKPQAQPDETVTVAGRFCESGDILIKNINLPNPAPGDILCVFGTGAYNFAMASNYNRVPRPAMVLINEGKSDIIVKRETYEDLTARDIERN